MGGNQANWATINARRKMAKNGSEDMRASGGQGPTIKALFRDDGDRSARLRDYMAHGPRGEREVEPLLDAIGRQLLPREPRAPDGTSPPRQTRTERTAWLRGVLDAVEDEAL